MNIWNMPVAKNSGGTSPLPKLPRACFEVLRFNVRIFHVFQSWSIGVIATIRIRTSDSTDWCYTPNICTLHIWKNCLFHQCSLLIDNNDYLPTLTHHLWINEERFWEKLYANCAIFSTMLATIISAWTTPKKAF